MRRERLGGKGRGSSRTTRTWPGKCREDVELGTGMEGRASLPRKESNIYGGPELARNLVHLRDRGLCGWSPVSQGSGSRDMAEQTREHRFQGASWEVKALDFLPREHIMRFSGYCFFVLKLLISQKHKSLLILKNVNNDTKASPPPSLQTSSTQNYYDRFGTYFSTSIFLFICIYLHKHIQF